MDLSEANKQRGFCARAKELSIGTANIMLLSQVEVALAHTTDNTNATAPKILVPK